MSDLDVEERREDVHPEDALSRGELRTAAPGASLDDDEHARLLGRLVARYSPPLSSDEVARCLDECIVRFEAAPVRTYLSVLVERAANDCLRARL